MICVSPTRTFFPIAFSSSQPKWHELQKVLSPDNKTKINAGYYSLFINSVRACGAKVRLAGRAAPGAKQRDADPRCRNICASRRRIRLVTTFQPKINASDICNCCYQAFVFTRVPKSAFIFRIACGCRNKSFVTITTLSLRSFFMGRSSFSIVAMGAIMTIEFVDGFIVAMLPSMLTTAWLVWRAA
jgi:hypothetical protein